MKAFLILATSAFLISTATIATFTPTQAFAGEEVKDAMKEMGAAFKIIGKDLKAGTITSATKLAGKTLVDALTSIQGVLPDAVSDGQGGERPILPTEVADFNQKTAEMLVLAQTLKAQLDGDDVAGATKTAQEMNTLKGDAHDQYKAD
ncbi:hypothetical protein BH10BDE1_BH10BDE1_33940 [soil metagenome]